VGKAAGEEAPVARPVSHTCHAMGCAKVVPPKMLMCLEHWRMVPRVFQQQVWKHYRPGQENDKRPSKTYLAAAAAAIEAVARKEGVFHNPPQKDLFNGPG